MKNNTKLCQIKRDLETNPNIIIVKTIEFNYLPMRDGFWSHTMNFFIAPKEKNISVNELQEMMMSLISLKQTSVDNFGNFENEIVLGKLYFDEVIGTEFISREIILTDPSMFSINRFDDKGKISSSETLNIIRRTWVRLYPSVKDAENAIQGKNEYRIPK